MQVLVILHLNHFYDNYLFLAVIYLSYYLPDIQEAQTASLKLLVTQQTSLIMVLAPQTVGLMAQLNLNFEIILSIIQNNLINDLNHFILFYVLNFRIIFYIKKDKAWQVYFNSIIQEKLQEINFQKMINFDHHLNINSLLILSYFSCN